MFASVHSKRKHIAKMSGSHLMVFDFDGVLFDDKRFKKDYESLFFRVGISKEKYEATYSKSKEKGHYDPRIHIKLAVTGMPAASVLEKNLYARVIEFAKKSHTYLYGDIRDFLVFLGEEEIRALVLSTGDTGFHAEKIAKSRISDLFDNIIIIPHASKVSALASLVRKEKPASAIFIDDKKEVLEEVKKSLPSVFVVQMRRNANMLPAKNADLSVSRFAELKDFVKEWKAI